MKKVANFIPTLLLLSSAKTTKTYYIVLTSIQELHKKILIV